jgi:hypothetical protein
VLPLGDFPPNLSPDLSIVQHFTASYFHPLAVVFLTPVKEIDRTDSHMTVELEDVKDRSAKRRYKLAVEYKNGKVMFLTGDIKDMLLKEKYYVTNRKYRADIHVTCQKLIFDTRVSNGVSMKQVHENSFRIFLTRVVPSFRFKMTLVEIFANISGTHWFSLN